MSGPSERPLYRHGDLLVRLTAPVAVDAATWVRERSGELARGETGHAHALRERQGVRVWRRRRPGPTSSYAAPERLVHVASGVAHLDHPEHATIVLPAGWYAVWRQRVLAPLGVHAVFD